MALLPVGKIVYVCDDVVADPVSHKPSILNLWEVVRVPLGGSFPYTLGKVCVVALMRDGEGEVRFERTWFEPTPPTSSAGVGSTPCASRIVDDRPW
jgi:hypothetical protein